MLPGFLSVQAIAISGCDTVTMQYGIGIVKKALSASGQLKLSFVDQVEATHCVKSVQIRSFFWSVLRISPYLVQMRENTDQKKLRIWTLFT